jgi:putative transposase
LTGYVEFLAYSLLPNHFHIILKVKDELDLETVLSKESLKNRSLNRERFSELNLKDDNVSGKLVVKQLKRLFITYSMAINKQEERVGILFDPKYKRLEITNDGYLKYAIFYTHYNSEKHGIVTDFKTYKYSSFHALTVKSQTKINRDYVFDLFGGKSSFLNYHEIMHEEREAIIIE